VCVHECRVTVEDDLYMATLTPLRDLRLLDLTAVLDEDVTEFDSLDMAVHMLFHAAPHSYAACRAIATAPSRAAYDGVAYPSYFSMSGAFSTTCTSDRLASGNMHEPSPSPTSRCSARRFMLVSYVSTESIA
jgi:hypothetical protein